MLHSGSTVAHGYCFVNPSKTAFHCVHSRPVHSPVIVSVTGGCDAVSTALGDADPPPPAEHAAATSAATAAAIQSRLIPSPPRTFLGSSIRRASSLYVQPGSCERRSPSYGDASLGFRAREQAILRCLQRERHRADQLGVLG